VIFVPLPSAGGHRGVIEHVTLYVRKGDAGFEVQMIEPQGTGLNVDEKKASETTLAMAVLGRW
jgi:hypothetical protein